MIEKLEKGKWEEIIPLLMKHSAQNYFNLLGILSGRPIYKDIYLQKNDQGLIESCVFQRLSGTVKFFASGDYNARELTDFLRDLQFQKLIGPLSCTRKLEGMGLFNQGRCVTHLCELTESPELDVLKNKGIRELGISDLDQVVEIYMEVFRSHASIEVMEEKLGTGRGRGFGLWQGERLVSVVQTDFETKDSALIVGVATRLNQQKKGYATSLLIHSIKVLQQEGKRLFLEYENPEAGGVYRKLGFSEFETVFEYKKL